MIVDEDGHRAIRCFPSVRLHKPHASRRGARWTRRACDLPGGGIRQGACMPIPGPRPRAAVRARARSLSSSVRASRCRAWAPSSRRAPCSWCAWPCSPCWAWR